MDPYFDVDNLGAVPRPLTHAGQAVLAFYERTGIMPRRFQVDVAVKLCEGKDVLCIAGTGSGKSIAFILVLFLRPDAIVWIVSPLNFIENQMATNYSSFGLSAVSVNAATTTPKLLEEIKKGRYQVIISSPESYKDANKLRPALLSKELARRFHVTIVDEAHVIRTWANNGFRVVYQRIGDMRVFMPNPADAPMCAATATCSPKVKKAIVNALHIRRNNCHEVNIGNWRPNLCYGLHVMRGGQNAYWEVADLLPPSIDRFQDVPQTVVFADSYATAHSIAFYLRQHYGLSGKAAREGIPVYHSLLDDATKQHIERSFRRGKSRIIIATEALAMGVDIDSIELVISFPSLEDAETWLQRGGRAGRARFSRARCFLMVTRSMVTKAVQLCLEAKIKVNPALRSIKREDADYGDVEVVENEPSGQGAGPSESQEPSKSNVGRRGLSIEIAEYIATGDCRTAVLDRHFDNPPHEPCIEVGGCDLCVKAKQSAEENDLHLDRRQEIKQETRELEIVDYTELKHKTPGPKKNNRVGQEQARFIKGLEEWREGLVERLLDECDISSDMVMTQKELERIAKTRGLAEPDDFDCPEVGWLAPLEWRTDVLQALDKLQEFEDRRIEEELRIKEEAKAERERVKAEEKAERERKKAEEKAEREQKKAEEKAERERKKAEEKAERERRAASAKSERERKADERERRAAERQVELQQQLAQETAREEQLAATQTPVAPRAIGTIQISRNGLPTPYTPSRDVSFMHLSSNNNTSAHAPAHSLPTPDPPIAGPSRLPIALPPALVPEPNDQPQPTPSRPRQRRPREPQPPAGEFIFMPPYDPRPG